MRAVTIHEFGGPEVLVAGDVPDPVAGPGQVVVDVDVANITFVETQVRAGRGPFPVALPHVPGNGVGGLVDGRRVVTSTGGSGG
jgi:NADPH2:quinone reductase